MKVFKEISSTEFKAHRSHRTETETEIGTRIFKNTEIIPENVSEREFQDICELDHASWLYKGVPEPII